MKRRNYLSLTDLYCLTMDMVPFRRREALNQTMDKAPFRRLAASNSIMDMVPFHHQMRMLLSQTLHTIILFFCFFVFLIRRISLYEIKFN